MSEQARVRVAVENAGIRYRVGDVKAVGLKDFLMKRLRGRNDVKDFWADRGISFELRDGDLLGIIGGNGAGKSTLLKAIAGILRPKEGSIRCRGRIAALLELATGFDGQLTVKENTYLRGAMLGFSRKFMDAAYEGIVDYAGLKEFENREFRQLSSGMKSRLAFAVSSLVKPDILILDEVLSVGDGAFKAKSETKMRELITSGAVTILVSHSLPQIRSMCNKILWLHKGRQVVFTDDVEGACDSYEEFQKQDAGAVPAYDPVAAKARIEARLAEKARRDAAFAKMKADAARLPAIEAELARSNICLDNVRRILSGHGV